MPSTLKTEKKLMVAYVHIEYSTNFTEKGVVLKGLRKTGLEEMRTPPE